MLLLFWFFGVKFTVRVVIFVVGRVLIFNLHSSCKKEKKKRKALTLDAIFFKDKLFFLNVAFIALWLYVYIVVVYRNKKIFSKGHVSQGGFTFSDSVKKRSSNSKSTRRYLFKIRSLFVKEKSVLYY